MHYRVRGCGRLKNKKKLLIRVRRSKKACPEDSAFVNHRDFRLQPNLSYKIIFLFPYCHWGLGLTGSDPRLFPQDSTHPHKKLSLYDLYKSCQTMNYAFFEFLDEIRRGRYSLEFLVGVCAPSSPNRDSILDQINVIFHTGFIPGP